MKLLKMIVLLSLMLAGGACGQAQTDAQANISQANTKAAPQAPQQLATGPLAPSWELKSASGRLVQFGGARERPAVLLFWATWCPFCKQLMPHLQSIKDQYGSQIEIFALNILEDDDPVAFLDEYGYQFELIPEADSVAPLYGVKGTPGLFLVDRSGRVRYNLYQVEVDKEVPDDLKRWQKAARLAPLWAAKLRQAIDTL